MVIIFSLLKVLLLSSTRKSGVFVISCLQEVEMTGILKEVGVINHGTACFDEHARVTS